MTDELAHHSHEQAYPLILDEIMGIPRVRQACNLIGNVLDLEESKVQDSFVIRVGISEKLDHIREVFHKLDEYLTTLVMETKARHPTLVAMSAQYMPSVGFVLRMDTSSTHNGHDTIVPEEFQFQFQENDRTKYYKNPACKILDDDPGDVQGYIVDIQKGIMRHLSQTLLDPKGGYEVEVHKTVSACARLDCLVSFARCALEHSYTQPRLHDDISQATRASSVRHPLQELTVDAYIPNDVVLGGRHTGMCAITGQNGSGKSVYLKLVGLLHYMAQIGSYVPAAEHADIQVLHKIFTRIQSFETAALSQSSFTIDCNQIAQMLHLSNPRSLLLIDEFGKGTRHLDGIALLTATMKCFIERFVETKGPRVVLTTHFLEIFRLNLLEPHTPSLNDNHGPLACYQMAIVSPDARASESTDKMDRYLSCHPLFELQRGVAGMSNALRCAAMSGIPRHVNERAQYVLECGKSRTIIEPVAMGKHVDTEEKLEKLMDFFYAIEDFDTCDEGEIQQLLKLARDVDV